MTGFGRIEGRTVGVVANQPMVLAGVLDIDASRKAARFVRFCDCFSIPLVTFVDVPGFLPGTAQEYGGLHQARRQASLRLSPRRPSQGDGDHAQGLWRSLRRHGLETSPRRHQLCLADGRDRGDGREGRGRDHLPQDFADPEKITRAHKEYEARFVNPFVAAERGYVDDVIMPHSTRKRVARALRLLRTKDLANPWKKHDNIPL